MVHCVILISKWIFGKIGESRWRKAKRLRLYSKLCQSSCNDKGLLWLCIVAAFCCFAMVAAYFINLLNLPFMVIFMLIYASYNLILMLTVFFLRIRTIDLTVKFRGFMKAIMLCFVEVTTPRFIMTFVRLTASKGYKKKKLDWGRIERKKMKIYRRLCRKWENL